MSDTFKPGDYVRFKGVKVGAKVIGPREGILFKNDRNATIKGVMSIRGDKDQMMFCKDGSIYCHAYLGTVIELVPETESAKLLKKLE